MTVVCDFLWFAQLDTHVKLNPVDPDKHLTDKVKHLYWAQVGPDPFDTRFRRTGWTFEVLSKHSKFPRNLT